MERHFIVFGSADALTAFASVAAKAGFEVDRRDIQTFSIEHVAMECLRLVFSKEGAAIVASLVVAIRAYLAAKSSRRITITKLEPDRVVTFEARGLDDEELEILLRECREILVEDGSSKEREAQPTAPAKGSAVPRIPML
jgi:hypothetical protein